MREIVEDFKLRNSEIRKEPELASLKKEYQGQYDQTSLRSTIEEGAKGESEVKLEGLSQEKERVTETIKSLNSDIKTFGSQFKAGDGKSFMKGIQQIDESLKAAAENVEDLGKVSASMAAFNKQTIATIAAAEADLKATQEQIMLHSNAIKGLFDSNRRIQEQLENVGGQGK